jgi:hypothetical protein
MNTRRLLWIGLAVVVASWLALLASGVWALQRYGMVGVHVHDRGSQVHVAVPGALVHWGLRAAEMAHWHSAWGPYRSAAERRRIELARNLMAEVARCPDAVYVEVESDHESVRISKQDGVLRLQVLDGDQRVQVTIPTALAYRAVDFAARAVAVHRRHRDSI